MGKTRGKRKCKNTYQYTVNRRKLWKKSKRLEPIKSEVIRKNWLRSKGVVQNMARMGLSSDPNRTIRIPDSLASFRETLPSEAVEATVSSTKKQKKKNVVVEVLEDQANKPQITNFRVSREVAQFAKYMTDKHGEDYKAMARDPINYYQLTPKQIKRKLADHLTSQVIRAVQIAVKMKD